MTRQIHQQRQSIGQSSSQAYMNTISYNNEDQGTLVPKPPKGTKNGKPLKSGKRENEYFQKKKIQELSSKIKREKSGERDSSSSRQK